MRFSGASGTNGDVVISFDPQVQSVCVYGLHATFQMLKPRMEDASGRKLFLSACHEKYNAANERHRAHDGRQRNIVSLFASSVNRSDVDDLFPSRIRKPTPG